MKLTTANEPASSAEVMGMHRFAWPEMSGPDQVSRPSGTDALTVEASTDADNYVLRVQLNGLHPDDVEIDITDHALRIRAERRKTTTKVSCDRSYRSEIRYCAYSRTFPLPLAANDGDGRATYRDGVVEVRIPLAKASTPAVAA